MEKISRTNVYLKKCIWYNTDMEKDIFNINKNQLSYGRGYVYSLQYHLVWCTKYRKKVLKDGIDLECKKMLQDLAEEYRFQILAMEVMPDHIHMLVDCRPQFYISDMIKIMKGNLARQMFLLHPELKKELWGGHLWNRLIVPLQSVTGAVSRYLPISKARRKKKRESPEYRDHSGNVCFCGKGGRRCGQYPAMVWRYENRISRSVRQWRSIVRQSVT